MNGINGGGLLPAPRINHGHGYSYTRSKGGRGERLPAPPFTMPRIPSERFVNRGDDQQVPRENHSLAPPNGSLSFSSHRRQHPLSLAESPTSQTDDHVHARPKSMDAAILPLQTPSSSTFSNAHHDHSIPQQDVGSVTHACSVLK